jgi:hypothetical protein
MSSSQRCKTHKYRSYSKNSRFRSDIYYCINCSSYKPKTMIIGTHSLCWKCGNEFIMNEHTIQLKPHCDSCARTQDNDIQNIIAKVLGVKNAN